MGPSLRIFDQGPRLGFKNFLVKYFGFKIIESELCEFDQISGKNFFTNLITHSWERSWFQNDNVWHKTIDLKWMNDKCLVYVDEWG